MNTKQKEKLIEQLNEWFTDSANNRNRWHGDSLGIFLKERLTQIGRWKELGRGNPEKGYEKGMGKNEIINKEKNSVVSAPVTPTSVASDAKITKIIQPKIRINSYSTTENYDYEPLTERPIEEEEIKIEQKILSPLEVLNSIVPKELIQGPPVVKEKEKERTIDEILKSPKNIQEYNEAKQKKLAANKVTITDW